MSVTDLFKRKNTDKNTDKASSVRNDVSNTINNPPVDLQTERAIQTSRRFLRRMRRAS